MDPSLFIAFALTLFTFAVLLDHTKRRFLRVDRQLARWDGFMLVIYYAIWIFCLCHLSEQIGVLYPNHRLHIYYAPSNQTLCYPQ